MWIESYQSMITEILQKFNKLIHLYLCRYLPNKQTLFLQDFIAIFFCKLKFSNLKE